MRDEPKYKRSYRRTDIGRAKTILAAIVSRCRLKGIPCDLDEEWLLKKLEYGRCEQTGIAFVFNPLAFQIRSPWGFSIDKIDPKLGYTKRNCQAVVWAYNAAKGQGTDADVMRMAQCLLGITPFEERGDVVFLKRGRKNNMS